MLALAERDAEQSHTDQVGGNDREVQGRQAHGKSGAIIWVHPGGVKRSPRQPFFGGLQVEPVLKEDQCIICWGLMVAAQRRTASFLMPGGKSSAQGAGAR